LAMEELSWGQHLFSFKTPEFLKMINLQGETNLHNLISFELFNSFLFGSINLIFISIPLIYYFKNGPRKHSLIPSLKVVYYFLFSTSLCLYSSERFSGRAEVEGVIFLLFFIFSFILLLKYIWEGKRELFIILTLTGITSIFFFLNNALLGTKVYEIREFFICFSLLMFIWEKRKVYRQRAAYILA